MRDNNIMAPKLVAVAARHNEIDKIPEVKQEVRASTESETESNTF